MGDTLMRIAIKIDALCVDCAKAIPDEQRQALAFVGGTYLCRDCRAKQAELGKPASAKRAVKCAR